MKIKVSFSLNRERETVPTHYNFKGLTDNDPYRWADFCLTRKELTGRIGMDVVVRDLSRLIILDYGCIHINQFDDEGGRRNELVTAQVARSIRVTVDTARLLKVVSEAHTWAKPTRWDEYNIEMDLRSFQFREEKRRVAPQLSFTRLIDRAYSNFVRQDRGTDKNELTRSILSFAKIGSEKMMRLRGELQRMLASDKTLIWGGGDGEIGFRWNGMTGAIIRRDDGFSMHT